MPYGDLLLSAHSATDRFGLGWRPQMAGELLDHLGELDVLEVMAEHFFDAEPATVRAIASLRGHVEVALHGVSMGLASARPVRPALVAKTAALVRALQPAYWSEHLAFVRGGSVELNALAVPPRNAITLAATVDNIRRASAIVGARPVLENAASVLEPPGSDRDQVTWLVEVLAAADCELLLDLHNVYANAHNAGFDPVDFIARLPPDRIRAVHLAGGTWYGEGARPVRLDTHCDAVPGPVFELLEVVGARATRPLTVIVEHDGSDPPIEHLLDEVARARAALARGRSRRPTRPVPRSRAEAAALEAALARVYANPAARDRVDITGLSPALGAGVRQLDPVRLALVTEHAEVHTSKRTYPPAAARRRSRRRR